MRRLAFAVLAVCLASAFAAHAAPAMYVEEPIYDFGETIEGYAAEHTFTIQNVGDELLEITLVRISCGCTTTQLETKLLDPGQSVILGVSVNTTGFSGHISKSIYLYSNDPNYADSTQSRLAPYTLRITGTVVRAQDYHISTYDLNYDYTVLIDLRDADAYASGHLLGAINTPHEELGAAIEDLPHDAWIVLYDLDGSVAPAAAQALDAQGFYTAYYLLGGIDAWYASYGNEFVSPATASAEGVGPGAQPCDSEGQCMRVQRFHDNYFMLLIDQRDAGAYTASHLLGAINVPSTEIAAWLSPLPRDTYIVIYDQASLASDATVQRNELQRYTRIRSLLGGLNEWIREYGDRFVVTAE